MTTHLSARLAWHDRGWDGTVCAAPHLNTSCIALRHIRKGRNDERERRAARAPFAELGGWRPPCAQDAAAFAPRGYATTYRDPLESRALPSAHDEMPPCSCSPIPYRWLREENAQEIAFAEGLMMRPPEQAGEGGWVDEPDRQRMLLQRFWQKLEPGKSLIFYYSKDHPLDEDAARVIVGVGRIAELGPQLYYGTKPGYQDDYPVWSRRVTQDYPLQGVRVPYQEYLAAGQPADAILCTVPPSAILPFSYTGEHVSDDIAVTILERMIQSIEQVRRDGVVSGDWNERLKWLNDALAEVWSGRGAFPGLGSVLQYLGFERGVTYQREVLAPQAQGGTNPWEYVLAALTGGSQAESEWVWRGLTQAGERWRALPESRRELLAELARFELSEQQIRRIADPEQRPNAGLARNGVMFSDADIMANPYLIVESYLPAKDTECLSLETIDHGMRPEGGAARFPRQDGGGDSLAHDDRRRVRAVAHTALEDAASEGDTLLPLTELLDRIRTRFPARRACQPDRDVIAAEVAFYQDALWLAFDQQPALAALNRLRRIEIDTARLMERLAPITHATGEDANARRAVLEGLFGAPTTERAQAALDEKGVALKTLLRGRLSVLTGGAGTGKTTVLRAFLAELERREGAQPLLLLAPTGKARVRLARRTGRSAMTVHQFLLKQGWLTPETLALRESSNKDSEKAVTVIIDECSMIPADLFGTLLRALDPNTLRRLVLVGDPNQLPPIGPGRPFIDIIAWLSKRYPERIAALRVCMRADAVEGNPDEESAALTLAEGYRADGAMPGDDEILAMIARGESHGDLDVVFWRDHDDLLAKLKDRMAAHLGVGARDQRSFDRSLGVAERDWARCEAWQILSPTRAQPHGVDELNHRIQREYRGRAISNARQRGSGEPRPFGDQEIVLWDKVMQTRNRMMMAWPRRTGAANYVANGEIGLVCGTRRGANGDGDMLTVGFSTQPEVTYRYWASGVDDNLELAYALTVHKAQGSDFDTVFFIVPRSASTFSRELIYTGLTRFRKRLVLLIERDITPLLALRSPLRSATQLRNTFLFHLALRPEGVARPYPDALIHRTSRGVAVRSKSEVIVADILDFLGVSYEYEKPLRARADAADFRLPDFTVSYEGEVYFWEHLGLLALPSYRDAWERKRAWYEANGYADRLIVSRDGPDGSIDAEAIERLARERILQRG